MATRTKKKVTRKTAKKPTRETPSPKSPEKPQVNFHNFADKSGEVLLLKRIPQNRKTHGDFLWPSGIGTVVECPDWNPAPKCVGGLHAWPWGFGLGEGCDYDIIGDVWLVLGATPDNIVGELEGGAKCKARRLTIRMEGSFGDAMAKVRPGFDAAVAAMASSGYNSTAASSGDNSKAASSGENSKAASSGENSTCEASGENTIAAIAGTGRIRVGPCGAFAVAYWSDTDGWRFLTGKVGENGIKADTWYVVLGGKLTEEQPHA